VHLLVKKKGKRHQDARW